MAGLLQKRVNPSDPFARHCEERSDAAIQQRTLIWRTLLDCFASLAMTGEWVLIHPSSTS
jgi:hypothetical protein